MNPYPGLRPFTAVDTQRYYGREALVDRVLTRVRMAPLTVFFARSGVGKSSFLLCRLKPELEKNSVVDYVKDWGIERPSATIENHRLALAASASVRLRQTAISVNAVDWTPDRDEIAVPDKPVLILDQFEDVFKTSDNRKELWGALARIANVSNGMVHAIVSMREEWLGAWAESTEFLPDNLRSTIRLAPLSDSELIRAIEEPAKSEGTVDVAAGFASLLIEELRTPNEFDLSEHYAPPGLVQLVCRRLWDEAAASETRCINEDLYVTMGRLERIKREYVWNGLRPAGKDTDFTPRDRVLWTGVSRYLTVAEDVKSLVSARTVASKLRTQDLGFAAPVATFTLSRNDRRYLRKAPEQRAVPPGALQKCIGNVLDKGVHAGFLKPPQVGPDGNKLYELVHDSLGPIFRQFGVEFDQQLKIRFTKVVGAIFLALTFMFTLSLGGAFALLSWGSSLKRLYTSMTALIDLFDRYSQFLPYVLVGLGVAFFAAILALIGWGVYRLISPVATPPLLRLLSRRIAPSIDAKDRSIGRIIATYAIGLAAIFVGVVIAIFAAPRWDQAIKEALLNKPGAIWSFSGARESFGHDASGMGVDCEFSDVPRAESLSATTFAAFDSNTSCQSRRLNQFSIGGFTLEAWVKPIRTDDGTIFSIVGGDDTFSIGVESGRFVFRADERGKHYKILDPDGIRKGKWHQVVATRSYSADRLDLYVDGIRTASVTTNDELYAFGPWRGAAGAVSAFGRKKGFTGYLYRVTLYYRASSALDVRNDFRPCEISGKCT